jgi:hypothetical protein
MSIKTFLFVIYGKGTDIFVNYYICYSQTFKLAWTNALAHYGIRT